MNRLPHARILCAALLAAASPAHAQESTPLLLEIWINGATAHRMASATDANGALLVDATSLANAGVKFSIDEVRPDGYVGAGDLKGVSMELVEDEQKLRITAPAERLERQLFDLLSYRKPDTSRSASGFLGQYDISATADDSNAARRTVDAGMVAGGTLFTPRGNFSTSGVVQTNQGVQNVVRFDSAYEKDDADHMRRLRVGDSVSGSQSWSRSVRFAGVQLATDFSMRPDISTMPLPDFYGQTAVPANVDIFVNSARVFTGEVDPGPFAINNLPVITGSGDATVVVRNALGQETTITLPFFTSSSLLREGLSSYSVEAGVLRRDYGQESFSYGTPATNASYSYGATRWLTLEAHGEAAKDVQLAGGGGALAVGRLGVLHLAGAASRNDFAEGEGSGFLQAARFESQMHPVRMFASLNVTQGNYADLASIGGGTLPKTQTQVGSNVSFGTKGTVGISYITSRRDGEQTSRITSASYNLSPGTRWNFGVAGFRDHTRSDTVAQLFFSYALGPKLIATSNATGGDGAHQQQLGFVRGANPDGGWGYRLSATRGDSDFKEGGATWVTSKGTLDGAFAARSGQQAARLTGSGGVVVMDGSVFATRPPDGSVALVETGAAGTDVYRENRKVATTDEDGKALVTGLVPYTDNHISIDPSEYKFSTVVNTLDQTVVPGRFSGVRVNFTPDVSYPALIALTLPDGTYPMVGAHVTIGDQQLVVGRHGEVFVGDMNAPFDGLVESRAGSCRFHIEHFERIERPSIPRIGATCQPEQAT